MYNQLIEIMKRDQQIKEILARVKKSEKGFPEGELICAKSNTTFKWYLKKNGKTSYLKKENLTVAQKLAQKKYHLYTIQDLENELKACEAYLKRVDKLVIRNKEGRSETLLTHPEYGKLYGLTARNKDKEIEEWAKAPYNQSESNHPENLIVKGTQGKMVRSKSEAIIDKLLFSKHLPFRYEEKLVLGNIIMSPDFTIRHPKTGEYFYWEHFGLMDDYEYVKHACEKIQNYCMYNIIPSVNLILTYESKSHPLEISKVEDIIREYFEK